ncbi:histidine phosphatase family protein [Microbacterium pygmaeum]|uniref:Broad specificity phosphatase PhoE n=1 Tax=Microbacterium pygmaeum TaxID=370764 RepID=A0A1G7WXT4_9MICO|nr:histidine phosphatase family protein [Microbacterium pygmaeum]SDG76714.1 Broad specificity phosphatase PhoE [Microbacterium pygmaeum]
MPADRLHLVRHGEVDNPRRVLYGRLPGYVLSDEGHRMAGAAALHVKTLGRPVSSLICSPLERTRQSAQPFAEIFGLEPVIDERVIEPTNIFEGRRMRRALANPWNWQYLARPSVPSWGEPYAAIVARMRDAMDEAWDAAPRGDVVIVSHQAPIWLTHLAVAGEPLRHDPRSRRCALSSVTSFERGQDGWVEVEYAEPVPTSGAVDVGAV